MKVEPPVCVGTGLHCGFAYLLKLPGQKKEPTVTNYPRLFFNILGFPPMKMNDKRAVTKHKAATARFMFPYPTASFKDPLISGPAVNPALKTIELIP